MVVHLDENDAVVVVAVDCDVAVAVGDSEMTEGYKSCVWVGRGQGRLRV